MKLQIWMLVLVLVVSAFSCAEPQSETADTILVNGKIITVDANDSVFEALAIRGGRIMALGTTGEIEKLSGPRTQRIDLQGRTATPGLLDAHCHFSGGGLDLLYELDLSYPQVESVADIVGQVRQQAARLQPDEWLRGRGWDEGKLRENRYVHAADLDPVSPENPVWLTHTMGHYGTANSVALRMAGITRQTPDPPGGTIDRDEHGNPTGVLKESAQSLVRNLIPDATVEQTANGIRRMVEEFHREGMTALKEPGIGPRQWEAYRQVLDEGALKVRVFALWRVGKTLEAARERIASWHQAGQSSGREGRLISGGVKLYIDGSGGARTAWLHEEWSKNFEDVDSGNFGYPVIDPEILREQIRLFHKAGIHVSVHSIGDRAIDWVVDSYALALEDDPKPGLRHGIIHANIPTDRAIQRMAQMQAQFDTAYPEPSAGFMWWIGDTYAGNFGPRRALRLDPFKTYLEKGIRWAGGSDFDVTPFPARYGIWASMARRTLLGVYGSNPYGQAEAIDVRNALRSYTIWSARQMFLEDEIGSLEPGKYADIAVWDRDIYSVPTDDVKDMKCLMTLFEGEVVYGGM